mgnify:CR=1 FL=1
MVRAAFFFLGVALAGVAAALYVLDKPEHAMVATVVWTLLLALTLTRGDDK